MNESEKEETKRVTDRSPSPGVKSTAVVKYTAFQTPVSYAQLQCNTDINLPPTNWGGIDTYGLKQILTGGTGLSSFRMAHMFPDCVGEVDVISDAECIKKLLKLPYQPNGTVSMMAHRVENTLLLDDFDVYDYLMKSEWAWLKDFFYENVLKTMTEKERMKLLAPRPSSALTQKFLSHSVAARPQPPPVTSTHTPMLTGPFLPEPETRPEEPTNEQSYNRNVLWTFEDIRMLIGSNLPIFGDEDRPCISLRLRDAREPINVLTGIDYWLDNLMCNVPEVLMCYHLDGIVQKYEPMKTEDLPNMENSKFSPKVIRNVAQNILSFLKSNATKAGHTYWLFKGPRDDVVKLYDLTSLCPAPGNPFTTPVAMLLYRVARNMHLMNKRRRVRELLEHVISLLQAEAYPQIVASSHYMLADIYVPATTDPACPDFREEKSEDDDDIDFPEFNGDNESEQDGDTDANKSGKEPGNNQKETDDACEKEKEIEGRQLALRHLGDRRLPSGTEEKNKTESTGTTAMNTPGRCGKALTHALRGLLALHHLTTDKTEEEERERLKRQIIIEEQHPKMANPCEPIKMDYTPIKRNKDPKEHVSRSRRRKRERKNSEKNYLIEKTNVDKNAILVCKDIPTWQEPSRDDNFAWKLHLKTLLYEKICLAYATMAEYSYADGQYGFSLKYIDIASKCQKLLSKMIIKSRVVDASCLIGRVGDNFFQISKHWTELEQFKTQFFTDHDIDSQIRCEIEKDLEEESGEEGGDEFDLNINKLPTSELQAMVAACEFYLRAESAGAGGRGRRAELLRRRASVRNELAVRYMNDAQHLYAEYVAMPEEKEDEAQSLLRQFEKLSVNSAECLNEAAAIFEQVNDLPNLALLYCNKARYLRFKAHCSPDDPDADHKHLYTEAEDLYNSALKLLGPRETCGAQSVRELVAWELSCHLYTRAVLLQERAQADAMEVAEAFKHALRACQLGAGPRQYLYQFRAAMIHHRLGSLHHAQYRSCSDAARRKRLLASATSHYSAAALQFSALGDAAMFLAVRLEHVAALEAHAAVTPNLKLKSQQDAIDLLRQSQSIMKMMKDRDPEDQKDQNDQKPEEAEEVGIRNEHSLLSLFENRLHFILKSVIQYCRSKANKDYDRMTEMYKKLYSASLKIKKDDDIGVYAGSIYDSLVAMDEISKEFD
ncbi:erythroid differentiation-related factor 1 [Aricia agestis]|uniref:erythroid differentiation-related factor 1 n=1 Tax=Aricia agestis TaxID=91739 RepID=UPI001C204A36|nr:erythroid differentiation-related factor 1 [Aricia agestis]